MSSSRLKLITIVLFFMVVLVLMQCVGSRVIMDIASDFVAWMCHLLNEVLDAVFLLVSNAVLNT